MKNERKKEEKSPRTGREDMDRGERAQTAVPRGVFPGPSKASSSKDSN